MNTGKVSPALAESLRKAGDGELLDVIVELKTESVHDEESASREEKIRARKAAFLHFAEPVTGAIREIGGEVTGDAWINGSLRARLSRQMIPRLSEKAGITRLDMPHNLQLDAVKL